MPGALDQLEADVGKDIEHLLLLPEGQDPILLAAQKMGVKPEECLMIGDTTVDMRAGKSAGAQTVGVLCGFGEEPELRKRGADQILKTTSELTGLLLKPQ